MRLLGSACAAACAAAGPAFADEAGGAASAGTVHDDLVATASPDEIRNQPAPETDAREPAPKVWRAVSMPEMVEQMMITARKREESLQRIPVAVTAFGSRDLVANNMRRLPDIDATVPNLTFDNALGSANSGRLTIRGVGQADLLPTTDPGVAIYIDGVYTPRAQGQLRALVNVDRVEVLRGPQGTLFGKNTIGGAVNVVTRRPEFRFGGEAELRAGNFGMLESRFSYNVPIVSERVAARISFASNYDEGYQKNVFTGRRGGTDRLLAGRADLLMIPSENLEVMLAADMSTEKRRPQAGKCQAVDVPLDANGLPTFSAQIFSDSGVRAACLEDSGRSLYKFASDLTARDEFDSYGLVGRLTWDLSNTMTLRSISAVRHQDVRFAGDSDSTPLNFAQPQLGTMKSRQRLWSQELQLDGRAMSGRLSYVFGAYAFGETIAEDPLSGLVFPDAAVNNIAVLEEQLKVNNRNLAAYGQASYAVTQDLTVTVGLRRNVERKRVRKTDTAVTSGLVLNPVDPLMPGFTFAGITQFQFEASERFAKYTPMAAISYEVTPDFLIYGSWTTGFRSGGFNGRANATNPDVTPVSQEDSQTYEIGFKSTFFEDRLRVNATAFTTDYEDIQRTLASTTAAGLGIAILRNAAEATLRGGEVEITTVPMTGLALSSSIGVFRGRYRKFDNVNDPSVKDARFVASPNFTLNLAAEYEFPLGSVGLLSSRLEWTQQGQKANDAADRDVIRTSRYGLLDGRMVLKLNDGQTEIAVFGENLLNREYFNNGADFSQIFGYVLRFPGEPRRYGVEVRRSF
jgi:iron complex outermembrane receptor protein